MHTRISTLNYAIWLFILGLQAAVCFASRHRAFPPLFYFLLGETVMGVSRAIAAKTIEAWAYFHYWIFCCFVHQALCAFLLASLVQQVRRRGLPSRQSIWPVQMMVGCSLWLAIYTSSFALEFLKSQPYWQKCLAWDHAFWYAMCCMIAFLPLYSFILSATLPKPILLIAIGVGIYAVAETHVLQNVIATHHVWWSHVSDAVYCLSLTLWFVSTRSPETQPVQPEADCREEVLVANSVIRENQL